MKNIILVALLLFVSLTGCDSKNVFEHHEGLDGYRWQKGGAIEFSPEITDPEAEYKVYLAFRHVYGFQFENLPVKVKTVTPSGKEEIQNHTLAVIGSGKEYYSDCAEDICDLEVVIQEGRPFTEAGTYKYTVEHEIPVDELPNVMEVGLVVEKVVKE